MTESEVTEQPTENIETNQASDPDAAAVIGELIATMRDHHSYNDWNTRRRQDPNADPFIDDDDGAVSESAEPPLTDQDLQEAMAQFAELKERYPQYYAAYVGLQKKAAELRSIMPEEIYFPEFRIIFEMSFGVGLYADLQEDNPDFQVMESITKDLVTALEMPQPDAVIDLIFKAGWQGILVNSLNNPAIATLNNPEVNVTTVKNVAKELLTAYLFLYKEMMQLSPEDREQLP